MIVNIAGREPDPKVIDAMLAEAPGQLNFTHFLTLFGEKLHGKRNIHEFMTSCLDVTVADDVTVVLQCGYPSSLTCGISSNTMVRIQVEILSSLITH